MVVGHQRQDFFDPRFVLLVAAACALQRPCQHRPVDELRFAPAAMLVIPGLVDEAEDFVALRVGQARRQRAAALGAARFGVFDRGGVFDGGGEHRNEILRRVKTAQFCDFGAVGPEDDGGGPAPALIALRDIRPAVLIDIDRDELVLEDAADFRVGPGLAVHHMAPAAPPGLQRDHHEFLLGRGAGEGGVAPFAPEPVAVLDRRRAGADGEQQRQQQHSDADHGSPSRWRILR